MHGTQFCFLEKKQKQIRTCLVFSLYMIGSQVHCFSSSSNCETRFSLPRGHYRHNKYIFTRFWWGRKAQCFTRLPTSKRFCDFPGHIHCNIFRSYFFRLQLLEMSAHLKPKRFHDSHVTVRMRNCIVILSSRTLIGSRLHQTWTYNLWTEQWRIHITENDSQLPQVPPMCGVAIDSAIYMFGGGIVSSNLWKLTPNTDGSFDWNMVCMENHAKPSPSRVTVAGNMEIKCGYLVATANHQLATLMIMETLQDQGTWGWIINCFHTIQRCRPSQTWSALEKSHCLVPILLQQ